MTNSMRCCRESELCCDFALFGVILMAFNLVFFYFDLKRGTTFIYDLIVASIVVWRSHFAPFTLFCRKFTFVVREMLGMLF